MSVEDLYFAYSNLLPIVWVSAALALFAIIWLLVVYRRMVLLKGSHKLQEEIVDDAAYPQLSVIVYTRDNPYGLEKIIEQIYSQDYPSKFEVVVVNDGSSEDVSDVVKRKSLEHSNLYLTFVPDEAYNLSRKKLAISLGVKAARYPYVMLTGSECRITSTHWMREMAKPFALGKNVSLGFAHISGVKGAMNRFDEALTGVKWLSAAIFGKPYRGNGYNIAYHRDLFFDVKGFSKSLTLTNGDDDVFVNQITDSENTMVVLSSGSVIDVTDHNPNSALRELRMSHSFTGRRLPKTSGRLLGFSTVMMWLWLIAVVVGIVFSLPNVLPSCFFIATIPLLWIPLVCAWRKTAKKLEIKLGRFKLPGLMLFRFIKNTGYKMNCGKTSRRNYTWLHN